LRVFNSWQVEPSCTVMGAYFIPAHLRFGNGGRRAPG
jgi:hypothetical protein